MRAFEPPMLIVDSILQLASLLTFSMREVSDGALLLSAWVEVILMRHHCQIKDWRYSLADGQVCSFCSGFDCVA
jgi:hypothetical protein